MNTLIAGEQVGQFCSEIRAMHVTQYIRIVFDKIFPRIFPGRSSSGNQEVLRLAGSNGPGYLSKHPAQVLTGRGLFHTCHFFRHAVYDDHPADQECFSVG